MGRSCIKAEIAQKQVELAETFLAFEKYKCDKASLEKAMAA